jgi:RimJ/RimL family protein N-acetyltransferase
MEAARAAHDWFDRVVTGRLVCMIDPRNERSIEIAEAIGYRPLRDAVFDGDQVRLFERNAPPQ